MFGRVIALTVVAVLGVASAVLGFIAEAKKLRRDEIRVSGGRCLAPPNPAYALGLCAVPPLLAALITISVLTGCCGCCGTLAVSSRWRRFVGIVCSVLSWIAAVIAVVFFVLAAAGNGRVTRRAYARCYAVPYGVFTRAAVLSLVATALGIFSYVMLHAGALSGKPFHGQRPHASEVPMGQPPQAQGYGPAVL